MGTRPLDSIEFASLPDGVQDGEAGPPGKADGGRIRTHDATAIQTGLGEVAVLDGSVLPTCAVSGPVPEVAPRQAPP